MEIKFFFGPELQYHRLWPDDPGNRLRGHQFGLRFATELWAEPSATTIVAADAALGDWQQLFPTHGLRLAHI